MRASNSIVIKHIAARTYINLDSLFASYNERHIYTYADVFATNKRMIYTAFDGKTQKSDILNHTNGESPLLYKNVAIYESSIIDKFTEVLNK